MGRAAELGTCARGGAGIEGEGSMTQGLKGSFDICSVKGCGQKTHGRGWCNLHYKRWKTHGDPLVRLIRDAGQGTPHISGYWVHTRNGATRLRHVLIAETALGHALPKGAEVHHINYDRGNDSNNNLVICPGKSYHRLLHRRTDALNACGDANWLKCWLCQKHGPPNEMKPAGKSFVHPVCNRDYHNAGYHRRKAEAK